MTASMPATPVPSPDVGLSDLVKTREVIISPFLPSLSSFWPSLHAYMLLSFCLSFCLPSCLLLVLSSLNKLILRVYLLLAYLCVCKYSFIKYLKGFILPRAELEHGQEVGGYTLNWLPANRQHIRKQQPILEGHP